MEDMYLKIGDIKGEAEGDLAGQITVLSFNFGATQSATMHVSKGGGSAAATVRDLIVKKRVDSASPVLFAQCANGTHIPTATLTVRKAGGSQIEYFKVEMEEVIISGYDVGIAMGDKEQIEETVTLNCARIKTIYAPQDGSSGGAGGTAEGGWSMQEKKPWPA